MSDTGDCAQARDTELFRGRLPDAGFQASETDLINFIKARGNTKPYVHPTHWRKWLEEN